MFYCLSYATVGLVGSLILMIGYVFARQGDLVGGEIFGIPPEVYNPLNEPSPLGLRLKKSESFVELVQMKLSQEPTLKSSTSGNKTHKGVAADKLKASNFPASVLKIGSWEVDSFDHIVQLLCFKLNDAYYLALSLNCSIGQDMRVTWWQNATLQSISSFGKFLMVLLRIRSKFSGRTSWPSRQIILSKETII